MTHATIDHLVTRVLDLAARTAPAATSDAEQQSFDDHLAAARPNATEGRSKDERNRDEADVALARRYDDGPKPEETRAEQSENLSESDDAAERDVYDEAAPAAAGDGAAQQEDTAEEDGAVTETNGEAATDSTATAEHNGASAVVQTDSESAGEKTEERPNTSRLTSDVQPSEERAKGIGPSEGESAGYPARPIEQPAESVAANASDEVDQAPANQESAEQKVSTAPTAKSQAELAETNALVDESEADETSVRLASQQDTENSVESTEQRVAASDRPQPQDHVAKQIEESPESTQVAPSEQAPVSNPQAESRELPAAKKPTKTKRATAVDKPTQPTQPVRPAAQPAVQPVATEATGLPEAASDAAKDTAQQPAPAVPSSSSATPTSATPDRTPLAFQQLTAEKAVDRPPVTEAQAARFLQRVVGAVRSASQGDGEVRLRLHPPELGSLRMQIKVEDGAIVARLETETQHARQLLLDNLPALRERLAGQDIRIERFDVDVQDDSNGNRQHQAEDRQHAPEGEADTNDLRTQNTETDETLAAQEPADNPTVDVDRLNVVI